MSAKPGYRRDGTRIKRPDAARLAKPKKVVLLHGNGSRALKYADLDLRSTAGKAYVRTKADLTAHLGGEENVTAPQLVFIDHAARLHVLTRLAWDEIERAGAFKHGSPCPAFDVYRRVSADLRDVLRTLGLERRAKQVPDLDAYLRSKERKRLTFKGRTLDAGDTQ